MLSTIRLHHLLSEQDSSIAVPGGTDLRSPTITGTTEWIGAWQNTTVMAGWDWGVLQDFVVLLNPQHIRTSIQLVDAEGRIEPVMVARIHLLHWIDSHPWREAVIQSLTRTRKNGDS